MRVLQTLKKSYKMQLCIKVMYRVAHQALKSTCVSQTYQILGFKRKNKNIIHELKIRIQATEETFWN